MIGKGRENLPFELKICFKAFRNFLQLFKSSFFVSKILKHFSFSACLMMKKISSFSPSFFSTWKTTIHPRHPFISLRANDITRDEKEMRARKRQITFL
jgi:hypothetical protein